ncbi:MAG: autotransporter domain-containing protein [Alphaproteobacteria bacterium]|nr:autotransporter domain-containing protein [Alphaproteobacteria bacterium]
MKYSNTAIKELSKRYRNILIKCALINAIALTAFSASAFAQADSWLATSINESQDVITVSKDMDGTGVVIEKSTTIDFNGHTYTGYDSSVGSTGTTTQLFQIKNKATTGDRYTVTLKNGTLNILPTAPKDANNFNFKMGIQNYVDLTLDNIVVDGSNLIGSNTYALSNNNGKTTIKNSTIIGKSDGFAFDVYHYASGGYKDGVEVTLAGGNTILGNIDIDTQGRGSDKAVLNMKGSNTITGNITNHGGTINVAGDLTLNGSMKGTGQITFANGSSLTTALDDTVKISADKVSINNSSLNLILNQDVTAKTYNFIESNDITGAFKIADNGLYSFKQEGGKIVATEKSSGEIAQNTGASEQDANALLAIIDANKTNGKGGALANALSNAVQSGNGAQAIQAAKEAAPTDSQFVAGIAKETANTLANVSLVRMDSIKGTSGGDTTNGAGIWAQGLYNHTKQDATTRSDGFSANSRGFAFGADKELSDSVMFGMGYAFMNTDADSLGRDIKVNSHNIFAYGKYQPSQWYICSILNYNISKYKERKAPMGVLLRSEYDVNSYGGQLMTGYEFKNGIRPYAGFRYLFVDAGSYFDGIQRVHSEKEDVLTSLVGIKYTTSVKTNDIMIRPTARIAATYDLLSENSQSNISVMGGSNYQMDGTRLHRFGIETVIGATATIDNVDITLEYNGAFRQDYRSQGGILRARYNF